MKEVCSCGAKFDTLDQLYQHINAEMGTNYSPDEFSVPQGAGRLTSEQEARLSALLSSPHHGYTLAEE
jgi:hypothetical protein